jgi:hypothetical protein
MLIVIEKCKKSEKKCLQPTIVAWHGKFIAKQAQCVTGRLGVGSL